LRELEASSSFEDAKEVYMTNKNKYSNSAYFFIDAYNYFYEDLKEEEYADAVIKDNFRLFEGNAVLLKALAYSYDNQERFKKSHELYKEVFILRPNYSQSFLDVANSYRNIKSNKLAAGIYARYDYLIEESFIKADTTAFDKILQREYNNLLALHKNEIMDSKKSIKVYVAEEDFKGTRLVFEWNDSEAEFDLQFVNPGNQYHMWKHSLADNSEVIYNEKDFGYNTTEYLIDGSLPGTWQVNVNYLGNKSLTPTFLKATVYYNYGTRSQRKEVKTFKLSLKNVNQELFKVTVGGKLVSR
jgi:tetratricopeptide (TPR) repeat protein